jgi:hypothetical protein
MNVCGYVWRRTLIAAFYCARTHASMHIYIYIYIYIHTQKHMCIYTHINTAGRTCCWLCAAKNSHCSIIQGPLTHMHPCFICIHIYVYTWIYIYIYTYTYIHTYTQLGVHAAGYVRQWTPTAPLYSAHSHRSRKICELCARKESSASSCSAISLMHTRYDVYVCMLQRCMYAYIHTLCMRVLSKVLQCYFPDAYKAWNVCICFWMRAKVYVYIHTLLHTYIHTLCRLAAEKWEADRQTSRKIHTYTCMTIHKYIDTYMHTYTADWPRGSDRQFSKHDKRYSGSGKGSAWHSLHVQVSENNGCMSCCY